MRRLSCFAASSLTALALSAVGAVTHAQTYGAPSYGGSSYGGQGAGTGPYGGSPDGGRTYGPPDQGDARGAPGYDGPDAPQPGGGYGQAPGYAPTPPYPGASRAPYAGSDDPRRNDQGVYGQGASGQGAYGQSGYDQGAYGPPPGDRSGFGAPDGEYGAPRDDRSYGSARPSGPMTSPMGEDGGYARDGYGEGGHGRAGASLSALLTCEGGAFGRDLGCRIARGDVRRAEDATLRALAYGAPQDWSNPRTGAYGRVRVLADGYGSDGYRRTEACRLVEESMTAPGARTETQRYRACPAPGGAAYGRDEGEGWSFSRL